MHLIKQTITNFLSKRQPLTYSSENMAARAATDKIIELKTTLQYLGVPSKSARYLFGVNVNGGKQY